MKLTKRQLLMGITSWKWLVVIITTIILLGIQYKTAFFMGWNLPQPNPNFFNYMLLFSYFGRGSHLYLFVLPLLAAFFGGSVYADEKLSGRMSLLSTRVNNKEALQQSLLSGFILGGTAGLFPLVCSGVIAIIHRPHMWFVDGTLNEYNYPLIDKESWVYGFYQQNQIALMLVTFVYVFILSGLFADIAVAVSFFTKKRYIEVIAPFVLVLALHIIVSNSTQISLYGLSHINFLKYGVAFTDRGPNELGAALTLPVLAGITAVLYSRKQAQDVL